MRKAISLLVVLFIGTLLHGAKDPIPEQSRHQKVYYFQHRLLPNWTFQSEGAFFFDLSSANVERMTSAATDIVDEDFAKSIVVKTVANGDAVLISFMEPAEAPECYHVVVIKRAESFEYVTLEKTEDILELGHKSVVGEWTNDGSHKNRGPRKYTDASSFVDEVVSEKEG